MHAEHSIEPRDLTIFQLCDAVRETSFALHRYVAQILGYMRACGCEHGLLINFGAAKLEIRKFILNEAFRATPAGEVKPREGTESTKGNS